MKEIVVFCLMAGAIMAKTEGILRPRQALITMCAVTLVYCVLALREHKRKWRKGGAE